MYSYTPNEVTGIRLSQTEGSEEHRCDARVEYNYKRFDFAPWGEQYLDTIKKKRETYEACFVKYDDGWRLKK